MRERNRLVSVDLSPKGIRGLISSHEVNETELAKVNTRVVRGLKLREEYGMEILLTTEQTIINHISRSIYLASKFLNLPIPDGIGFLTDEMGLPDATGSHVRAYTNLGRWSLFKPRGFIYYSPYFLMQIVDYLQGDNEGNDFSVVAIRSLAEVSSHEMFHVSQAREFPKTVGRHTKILGEDPDAWEHSMTEVGARRFGERFGISYTTFLMGKGLI